MLTYADAPTDLVRTAVSGNLLFDASKSKAELGKTKINKNTIRFKKNTRSSFAYLVYCRQAGTAEMTFGGKKIMCRNGVHASALCT